MLLMMCIVSLFWNASPPLNLLSTITTLTKTVFLLGILSYIPLHVEPALLTCNSQFRKPNALSAGMRRGWLIFVVSSTADLSSTLTPSCHWEITSVVFLPRAEYGADKLSFSYHNFFMSWVIIFPTAILYRNVFHIGRKCK